MTCKTRCLLAIEREEWRRGADRSYYAATRGALCASCDELARDTLSQLNKPHACVTCGKFHGDECPRRASSRPPPPAPAEAAPRDALDTYLDALRARSKPKPTTTLAPELVRAFPPKPRK